MRGAPTHRLLHALALGDVPIDALKANRLPRAVADGTGAYFHGYHPPIFGYMLALKNRGQPLACEKPPGALLSHGHRGRGDKFAVVLSDEFLSRPAQHGL